MNDDASRRYPVYALHTVLHSLMRNETSLEAIRARGEVRKTRISPPRPQLVIAVGVNVQAALVYAFDLPALRDTPSLVLRQEIAFW
ncbi:MAG: hypothetical protein J7452_10590 [Thermoflexus sp.]|nr:hypothetical protein [Thermoflexus sp.]